MQRTATHRHGGRRLAAAGLTFAIALLGWGAAPVMAQAVNPVYVDDSPAAGDTLLRVRDHLVSGNLNEAARVLQVLLDEMPNRLVGAGAANGRAGRAGIAAPAPGNAAPADAARDDDGARAAEGVASIGSDDRDLFRSVRTEVNRVLLGAPELLDRYRQLYGPVAKVKLDAGEVDEVERSYLLTSSGFEAALRVAQRQMEDAKFAASLLTLKQLEDHPDRQGRPGEAAGTLAAQVARYMDEAGARELAARWGGMESGAAVQWPPAARIRGITPLDGAAKTDLGAVLGKPLRSVPAVDRVVSDILQSLRPVEAERLPPLARHLLVVPTVADDTLYLNDGLQVTAWDRITLTPRWVVRGQVPTDDELVQTASNLRTSMRGTPGPEDPTMVTVSGRTAVAPMGLALGPIRWPDSRLMAIDTLTGRLKWAVAVDELDPALRAQSVRGPAVISEGTVVVALRASLPDRRMVTLYQAGLDLATGELEWFRLLGSTGALPYRNDPYVTEAAQLSDGVVYHSDMLGVVSATEASTGRPVWVRRIPPVSAQTWDSLNPWQIGRPVLDGDSVIVLSPDHRHVVRLDRKTGELRSWCPSSRFDHPTPRYLVRVGSMLAVVFDGRIAVAPLESFETGRVQVTPRFPQPGINGRVSAAGDKLLVPVVDGVMVVDSTAAENEPVLMPLDSPGNVLALESQLLVVDDASVHSYLLWEVAEKLLSERMAEAPGDPTAAATLAELAYRAGRYERIVDAADAALAALRLAPESEEAEPTRARLFASLATMVSDSLEPIAPAREGQGEVPAARITADALLGDLVDRMQRAARTGDERLTHLLSLGRLCERRGQPVEAVNTYQAILDDEVLASSTWVGPRLSTRGELEVTRRLESMVRDHGAEVYAAHDAKATAEAEALSPDAAPERIMRLATRYPVASVAASLWERAADAYERSGRDHAVVGAMESALAAAERLPGAPRAGEVAGRLIAELEERQQYAAAGNALKNVQERYPGARIAIAGQTVDTKELAERLAHLVAARQRWPRVGSWQREGVQVINGWAVMDPLMRLRSGVSPRGVILKSSEQIALYTPAERGAGAEAAPDELVPVWKRTLDMEMFELVRLDSEAAYFFFASAKGAVIEKVSQSPAALKWQTPLFADLPPRSPATRPGRREMEARVPTPQDGMALLTDGVITMDDRTMVLLERQGYATALDTQSGAVLWTIRSPLDRVYDAAVAGGTLVVAGDQEVSAGPGERISSLRPEIVVLDARTGQEVQRLPQRWGGVRWIRITDSGLLIAGCENAITSTDLSRGQVNWVLSDPHLSASRDAWVFQNAVFILDQSRRLWWADARTGRVSPDALAAPRERLDGVRRIEAWLLAPASPDAAPQVAFSTYQGVLLYDLEGNLKGVDAVGQQDSLLPPVPAHDRLVTLSTLPDGRHDERQLIYSTYALDISSAMVIETGSIVLGVPPRNVTLLDGRVVITSGGTCIVVLAPAAKGE